MKDIIKKNTELAAEINIIPEQTQEIIIEFLKKLYDPNGMRYRRTGRTTIMAKAFLRIAQANIGEKIRFHDHYPGKEGIRSMNQALRHLLRVESERFVIIDEKEYTYYLGEDFLVFHEIPDQNERLRP